jgi:hypothetical protein
LTLDVADVNRNGFAEIIVTSVVEDDLRSFILEYEEGKFKKVTEKAGWYFRVLDHPKEGPVLMGQQMGSEGVFVGPIYRFIWKKKSFEKGPKMSFPKETTIFGLTLADLRGKGKPELIRFDSSERLNIVSEDGKSVWRSSGRFGGTNNFYETRKKKESAYRPQEAPPWRVYVPSRLLIKDLDGDGIHEIIVSRNEFASGLLEKAKIYDKGEIYNLVWEQDSLTTNWKTREVNGYIADYQVKDADNDGQEELVVALIPSAALDATMFSRKSKSNILFFKLY